MDASPPKNAMYFAYCSYYKIGKHNKLYRYNQKRWTLSNATMFELLDDLEFKICRNGYWVGFGGVKYRNLANVK